MTTATLTRPFTADFAPTATTAELAACYERIAQLEAVLGECAAWFDQRSDVVDGHYGVPAPNAEMKMMCLLDEVL